MVDGRVHRVYFDWIGQGASIDSAYAAHVARKAAELSCDVIIFGIQEGGYVCYDSGIAPKIPLIHKDVDVLRSLIDEAHANGIKVVPMWLETVDGQKGGGCRYEAEEHPDWRQRSATGEALSFLCFNSPFRDYQLAQVREVLENYDIDGVYFDQFPMSCHCEHCRFKFRKMFNYDIPSNPQPGTREWTQLRAFAEHSICSFCADVRSCIAECRSDVAFIQNVPYWEETYIPEVTGRYADIVLPEVYLVDRVETLELKAGLTKAYSKKPIWFCVRHVTIHDARINPIPQTLLLLSVAGANRFSPTMLEFSALDYNKQGREDIKQTLSDLTKLDSALEGTEPLKYCALLHSKCSEAFYFTPHLESFEGFHRLLIEQHIPFEILTEEDIGQDGLSAYKVLILPNTVCLHKNTVKGIERFTEKGGGVVATFMSGLMDEDGTLSDRLQRILGRSYVDVVARDIEPMDQKTIFPYERGGRSHYPFQRTPSLDTVFFHYARVRAEQNIGRSLVDSLLSFFGAFVEAEYSSSCSTVVDILEADQAKINMLPYNRRGLFPGRPRWPLLSTREEGGRSAYFSAQIGAEWRRSGSPQLDHLLGETIWWVGNCDFPVRLEHCPPSVEVKIYRNPSSTLYAIVLINLTTSRIQQGHSQPFSVFKYVVPVNNIVVEIERQGREERKVLSLIGQPLTKETSGDVLRITVPELNLYECLSIELQ
jgi:hypothetical protein